MYAYVHVGVHNVKQIFYVSLGQMRNDNEN